MSQQNFGVGDPLGMIRQMWGNLGFNLPGMVVPTLDSDELGKRIADLKAVEGWLSMNLSMLQMTIRSLEMQRTTIETVKAMGEMATQAGTRTAEAVSAVAAAEAPAASGESGETTPPGMWPWAMMQQIQDYLQQQAASVVAAASEAQSSAEEPAETAAKAGKKAK